MSIPKSNELFNWSMGADFCLEMIERGTSSESSFISDTFALSLMLSESGRNSEEAVFEDRESCGR